MNDEDKIKLALKHLRSPFWFVEDLTDRQREAVGHVARGLHIPRVVAPAMGMEPKTVYVHLQYALKKINRQMEKELTFRELPETLMNLVEEVLTE